MKHDESKLPKWAQKRLLEAREESKTITIMAHRSVSLSKNVCIDLEILTYPLTLLSGDCVRYDIQEIISLI